MKLIHGTWVIACSLTMAAAVTANTGAKGAQKIG